MSAAAPHASARLSRPSADNAADGGCPLSAEAGLTQLTLEKGHKHYKTHSHELFWEHLHDTKCLMVWGDDAILLAFRGTASMANARADLQVT